MAPWEMVLWIVIPGLVAYWMGWRHGARAEREEAEERGRRIVRNTLYRPRDPHDLP